jgi:glycosyltransferase involved in cell wall biosynthesis
MMWLCVLFLVLVSHVAVGKGLNIALHAQVAPSPEKVVGSVITTDGMKVAFRVRGRFANNSTHSNSIPDFDIQRVETFYPFSYDGFLDTKWNLIIIEGWFLSMHEFIQIARSQFPNVIILFYCLDPAYPGLEDLVRYDVDGYLTNSVVTQEQLAKFKPTIKLLLAADEEVMRPAPDVVRSFGAVYVGAGGAMIVEKPQLLDLLDGALPFKLLLHGNAWSVQEILALSDFRAHPENNNSDGKLSRSDEIMDKLHRVTAAWQGKLPRDQLAVAYSRAEAVISSTMRDQARLGMINNRVFEALSCGSIIISDNGENNEAIKEMVGSFGIKNGNTNYRGLLEHFVLFANSSSEVSAILEAIRADPQRTQYLRQSAREFILTQHTYKHRVMKILEFFDKLRMNRKVHQEYLLTDIEDIGDNNTTGRQGFVLQALGSHLTGYSTKPKLLLIVNSDILSMQDYTYLGVPTLIGMSKHYDMYWYTYPEFLENIRRLNDARNSNTSNVRDVSDNNNCYPHGDMVCLSSDAADWLRTFSLLFGIGMPFDMVYQLFEELPSILTTGSI